MKKVTVNAAKLQLNKNKITNLTEAEMGNVVGGFTASLSLGTRCGSCNVYCCPKSTGICVEDSNVPPAADQSLVAG